MTPNNWITLVLIRPAGLCPPPCPLPPTSPPVANLSNVGTDLTFWLTNGMLLQYYVMWQQKQLLWLVGLFPWGGQIIWWNCGLIWLISCTAVVVCVLYFHVYHLSATKTIYNIGLFDKIGYNKMFNTMGLFLKLPVHCLLSVAIYFHGLYIYWKIYLNLFNEYCNITASLSIFCNIINECHTCSAFYKHCICTWARLALTSHFIY